MGRAIWLGMHVAAGFIALFMAPAAMLTRKGGKAHRRWGKIHFWAMSAVAVTASVLVLFFGSTFFNLRFLPLVVRWMWPTVAGTVGLTLWSIYYRRRFDAVATPSSD